MQTEHRTPVDRAGMLTGKTLDGSPTAATG
jgi:hypothetical protein